jgi:hypothetical protein
MPRSDYMALFAKKLSRTPITYFARNSFLCYSKGVSISQDSINTLGRRRVIFSGAKELHVKGSPQPHRRGVTNT